MLKTCKKKLFFIPRMFRAGLTLMEMVVVIAVVSMILAITFSSLSSLKVFETERSLADSVKDMIQFAKESAVNSGEVAYLEFNLESRQISLYRYRRVPPDNDDSSKNQEESAPVKHDIVKPIHFGNVEVVKIRSGNGTITEGVFTVPYSPDGGAGEFTAYVGERGKVYYSVVAHKYSSGVEIIKGEDDHEGLDRNWKEELE